MSNGEWMTALPQPVRNISVINLSIPGSHNSMTFGITSKSRIAPDADASTRRLNYIFPWFVRRWAKTQSATVSEQLEVGVRYFDLRICKKKEKFYYTHGLCCMEIEEPLQELITYLDKHPGEVVVLDFQHFYAMQVSDHMRLHTQLLELFENRLYTPADGKLCYCTLARCQELSKQVLLVYRRCPIQLPPQFWPSSAWPTPWPNVDSAKKLRSFLQDSLLSRKAQQGYVSQCIITPTGRYIALRFLSSLRNTAKNVDKQLYPWIETQRPGPFHDAEPPTVNVLLGDYVHMKDAQFCNWVIGLNDKLLEESTNVDEVVTNAKECC